MSNTFKPSTAKWRATAIDVTDFPLPAQNFYKQSLWVAQILLQHWREVQSDLYASDIADLDLQVPL